MLGKNKGRKEQETMKKVAVLIGAAVVAGAAWADRAAEAARPDNEARLLVSGGQGGAQDDGQGGAEGTPPPTSEERAKLLKRAEASQGQITKIQPALGMLETSEAVKKGEVAGYVSVALYWAQEAQQALRGGSFRGDYNQFILRTLKAREYLKKADAANDPTAALVLAFVEESRLSYAHTAEEITEQNAALTEKVEQFGKATKRENERLSGAQGTERGKLRPLASGGGSAMRAHSAAMEEKFGYNISCRLDRCADARRYYVVLSDVEAPALSVFSDEAVAGVVAAFDRAVALGAEGAELERERFKARVATARRRYAEARDRETYEKTRARLFEETLD